MRDILTEICGPDKVFFWEYFLKSPPLTFLLLKNYLRKNMLSY